jgi:cytidylate kinase
VAADDAIVVDSTGLSIDEVFQKMMTAVNERKTRGQHAK